MAGDRNRCGGGAESLPIGGDGNRGMDARRVGPRSEPDETADVSESTRLDAREPDRLPDALEGAASPGLDDASAKGFEVAGVPGASFWVVIIPDREVRGLVYRA